MSLRDVNETLDMIREKASHVSSSVDAEYASREIEMWLDQLNREIEELKEIEERENEKC